MMFILNTGRSIRQGKHIESKFSKGYSDETSACYINPLDLMELNIEEGDNVLIISSEGSVVLKTVSSDEMSKGMIFVAYGPFVNHIIPAVTHGTGMPDFKNIMVKIVPTLEPIKSAPELIEELGGLRYEN